jgi:hypothetical protein
VDNMQRGEGDGQESQPENVRLIVPLLSLVAYLTVLFCT